MVHFGVECQVVVNSEYNKYFSDLCEIGLSSYCRCTGRVCFASVRVMLLRAVVDDSAYMLSVLPKLCD